MVNVLVSHLETFVSIVCMFNLFEVYNHSRPQRPRSYWSAPGIETSIPGADQKDRVLWDENAIEHE